MQNLIDDPQLSLFQVVGKTSNFLSSEFVRSMNDSFCYKLLAMQCGTQILTMACASSKPIACSFFGNGKITCGESRGKVDVISVIECVVDVTYHLKSCHLSLVKITEYELILARAGNFHPSHDEITKLAFVLNTDII